MLKRNKPETTGHDLLAEYADEVARHQQFLVDIAEHAAEREAVVDSRLEDLEAEKLVLKQLSAQPG